MNTKQIHDAIKAIEGLTPTTLTARMRSIHEEIEARLAAGIRHTAILDALNEAGWNISWASYKGILQRLRQQVRDRSPHGPTRLMASSPSQSIAAHAPSIDPRAQREQVAKAFIPDIPANKIAARIAAQSQEKKS